MSKYSRILVCGDSYSSDDYKVLKWDKVSLYDKEKADYNKSKRYICWPEIVSNYFHVEVTNLSECGFSNDEILYEITNEIGNDQKYDLVIAALSPWYRTFVSVLSQKVNFKLDTDENKELKRKIYKSMKPYELDEIPFFVEKFYRNLIYLECICNKFDIPLIACQMITPYDKYSFKENNSSVLRSKFNSSIIRNNLSYHIEGKNFIGWPFIDDLGGFVIDNKYLKVSDRLHKIYKAKGGKVYELDDSHPNQKGHEKIANVFIRKIDETKIFDSSR